MAATNADRPLLRRLSQVYVEIPPSPLHRSRAASKHSPHVPTTTASRKENALLYPSPSQMSTVPALSSSSHKRSLDRSAEVADQPVTKKSKSNKSAASGIPQDKKLAGPSEEFPSGFAYCHQCNKKRDRAVSIYCTVKDTKGRRCGAKYCKPCLKNRYGLVLEDILGNSEEQQQLMQSDHVQGQGYIFKCPRCDDFCNCVACRKAKGLQPTGSEGNPQPHAQKATAPSAKRTRSGTIGQPSQAKHSSLQSLPKVTWTPVNLSLSLREAEERIHIREFSLRFASVLDISRTHQEELEELKPSRTRNAEEDDDALVPWVSETCVKSLILGLLSLFDVRGDNEKCLQAAIKSVRDSGANLNKIWAALANLRDRQNVLTPTPSNSRSPHFFSSLPDPLPPSESATVIRTRSGRSSVHTEGVNVGRTAQLVPVVAVLVNAAVETEAVREEIEAGIQKGKERARDAREAYRLENERFNQATGHQKAKDKKARMEHHKHIMADIDGVLKVSLSAYTHRISPLGRDTEGRIYWALTPGLIEREAALDRLRSYSQGRSRQSSSKVRRRPLVPSEEDRRALKKWSWFLAVWGTRPSISESIIDPGSEDDVTEDGEDEKRWWGFWDPDEITKLVAWMHSRSGLGNFGTGSDGRDLDDDSSKCDSDGTLDGRAHDTSLELSASPTRDELESFLVEVERYATLLKCRMRTDEEIV
ncbi:hypothetical protein F5I97DRAFT_1803661 [Phlebopus sp. FC_14]|nr:hypothetical protein F5I97DRAFT_1803661 [Phlebopus sp. FC_14]